MSKSLILKRRLKFQGDSMKNERAVGMIDLSYVVSNGMRLKC